MLAALTAVALLHLTPPSPETPYREPRMAVSGHTVALAFGSGNGIYVATSKDDGATFGKPVLVGGASVVPLSRHRGPRVVFSQGAIVVTAVLGEKEATGGHAHGLPADGNLLAWRSTDSGQTWSQGVRINDEPAAPREGLHTLAVNAKGDLYAAWLDLRKEGTRLYGSKSLDGGRTWSKNQLLYESPDGTICQCCHPSAGFSDDGTLEVMWRNAVDGSRDFYMLRARDGKAFGPAEKLGLGTWKINACPMDGGDLTHVNGKPVSVWRRNDEVFVAEPGKAEVSIGNGHDIAAAGSGSELYAAWVRDGKLVLWKGGTTEAIGEGVTFPTLATLPGGGVLIAWEQAGGLVITRR